MKGRELRKSVLLPHCLDLFLDSWETVSQNAIYSYIQFYSYCILKKLFNIVLSFRPIFRQYLLEDFGAMLDVIILIEPSSRQSVTPPVNK